MNPRTRDSLIFWGVICALVALLVWVAVQVVQISQKEAYKTQALSRYARRTHGHLEKYVSGTHIDSVYAGSIPDSEGKSHSRYRPIEVKDYSWRVVYFDDRHPYYPEENDEWLVDLEQVKAEEKAKQEGRQ